MPFLYALSRLRTATPDIAYSNGAHGHCRLPLQDPAAFPAGLEKTFLKRPVRPLIDKQILPVVPAIDHVIHTILTLDS